MNASILLLILGLAGNTLFCGTALDAFKSLVEANKAKQRAAAYATSTSTTKSEESPEDYNQTSEPIDETGTPFTQPNSAGPANTEEELVKVPQFRRREESKYVELKLVDGANNGGAASTPNKNLAAWFSEDLYDTPTRASWLQDDKYDPNAIANGFAALKRPSASTEQRPTVKSTAGSSGRVLTPVGSGGAGAMMGGGGGTGGASTNNARADDNFRQAIMQQGRAQREDADTGARDELRKQQREEESRARKAKRDARAARFRATASTYRGEGS